MKELSPLPNDLAACQALLAERSRELAEQRLTITTHELTIASLSDRLSERDQKLTALEQKTAEQKVTIDDLLRRMFAKKSERYLESPDQLRLDFQGTAAEDAAPRRRRVWPRRSLRRRPARRT